MFCNHCGKELEENSVFCTYCGTKQIVTPAVPVHEKTAEPSAAPATSKNRPGSKRLQFAAAGMLIGAVVLSVILLVAGVFSAGRIEGPGFGAPEDAAKAYLAGLRNQDVDAMVSAFAVETYTDHYDFEAMVKRLNAYTPNMEIRLPSTSDYTLQMNMESRRSRIVSQIFFQYMQYQAPDVFKEGDVTTFEDTDVSDFVEEFEKDTKDYVFKDISIIASLNMQDIPDTPSWNDIEDLIPEDSLDDLPTEWLEDQLMALAEVYKTERNQDHIAQFAKIYGADIEDVANVVVFFEADHKIWAFCPQMIRLNGKWYIDTLQGNLASLAGLSVFTGGIIPIG